MLRLILKTLLFFTSFGLWVQLAFPQPATIKGKVTVKNTDESLAGVNVLLQGTTRGKATDVNGEFQFSDLRPGTYGLTFSLVGYQREIRSDIAL
ncbi:MAG: carboxypeptidase-like regulatory domain-containing protein, partial [Bacteroidota bacterium]